MGRGGHGGERAGRGGGGGSSAVGIVAHDIRAEGNRGRDGETRSNGGFAAEEGRPNGSGGRGSGLRNGVRGVWGGGHGAKPQTKAFMQMRFNVRAAHEERKRVADAKSQAKCDQKSHQLSEASLAQERKLAAEAAC